MPPLRLSLGLGVADPEARAPLFHTTSYARVERIAAQGLQPGAGGSVFQHGGYGAHSAGRVFLAGDPEAARSWFGKVADMLEYHTEASEETLDEVVPVMLRIDGMARPWVKVDPLGDRDVPGSYYVERAIPPRMISWWSPSKRSWQPLGRWGADDARHGVKRWERDGGEATPLLRDTYDPGGFKPGNDAQYGAAWKPAPVTRKPRALRVVWRGDAEATVREVFTTFDPARATPEWLKLWLNVAIRRDGSLDLQFLNIKAAQYGYPDGVEVVGYYRPSAS